MLSLQSRLVPGRAAILVLVCTFLAAGCGSDRLNREELLARADRICKTYDMQQNSLPFPSTDPTASTTSFRERAQWGAALNQIVLLGRQEGVALEKLRPPEALEADYRRLLDAKDAAYDSLAATADAAKRNQPDRIKKLGAVGRKRLAEVTKLADAFGVSECG